MTQTICRSCHTCVPQDTLEYIQSKMEEIKKDKDLSGRFRVVCEVNIKESELIVTFIPTDHVLSDREIQKLSDEIRELVLRAFSKST